uniref:Uncharacterized protein n=1 Tax=Euplotes crassus TaxID=5936 RepID=A0A7S3NXR0_EUPCR|mmetsp:Transcript_31139/g.30689  ORF Transcript_31139/g.30689 Transcript_31139/m.30689 type:complete len:150 (+) Transcript_31139:20-469(+)
MANCLLRIGILIILVSQVFLGYNRVFKTDEFNAKFIEKSAEYQSENIVHSIVFGDRVIDEKVCEEVYHLDIFYEFVIPVLMLLTGWRIWTAFILLHLVGLPAFLYNISGHTRGEFEETMRIMIFIQILAVLFYTVTIRSPKKGPIAPHP